jgi:hypothetical protein
MIFFLNWEFLKDLIHRLKFFWPEAKENFILMLGAKYLLWTLLLSCLKIHNNSFISTIVFINLGGYKENEFEEYHYKMLAVANKLWQLKSKTTAFTNIVLRAESHLTRNTESI